VRITVVLVGGRRHSTRMISLPGAVVVGLGCWLALSLIFGSLVYLSHSRNKRLAQANEALQHTLSATQEEMELKTAEFVRKEQAIEELTSRFERVKSRFDDIHELDGKIRNHLGLEAKPFVHPLDTHQGGIPALPPYGFEDDHADIPIMPKESYVQDRLLEYADFIHEQCEEVLDFLSSQEDRIQRMPSILPVQTDGFWVSSPFGWRADPFTGRRTFHNGLDIAGPSDAPIIAPADGTVIEIGRDRYMGKVVKIDHGSGITTLYGHLSRSDVKINEKVNRGQMIARMGNTGRSTGTHLHYSVIKNDSYVDPINYIWDYDIRNNRFVAQPFENVQ